MILIREKYKQALFTAAFCPFSDSTETQQQGRAFCLQGVQAAEAGRYDEALGLLNRGIELAPERAAGYNDRAQLYRLMKRDDGTRSLPVDIPRATKLVFLSRDKN